MMIRGKYKPRKDNIIGMIQLHTTNIEQKLDA